MLLTNKTEAPLLSKAFEIHIEHINYNLLYKECTQSFPDQRVLF